MDSSTILAPGLPVYTRDRHEIGHVAEVREDAFRVDVRARPDYWLSLEDVQAATQERVELRIREDEVGDHRVAEPGLEHRDGAADEASPFITPVTGMPGEEPADPYLDIERHRIR